MYGSWRCLFYNIYRAKLIAKKGNMLLFFRNNSVALKKQINRMINTPKTVLKKIQNRYLIYYSG